MRRYELASGILFTIIALGQLTRVVLGWPMQVDGFAVPVWMSGIAFLLAGGFAVWGFRTAGRRLSTT